MSSTTLVTFLVQAPRFARRVDLFGSWDNFSKAYPMERDQRMGSRQWRGCHSFTDIICDGDASQVSNSRDGGLMMGGIYWYYYQINGDVEYHNPAEPCTTACPYLPGQDVNVLEVPMQISFLDENDQRRSSCSISSGEFTLNPNDKYITPRPPEEESWVRCSSSISYVRESATTPRTDLPNTIPNDEAKCEQIHAPAEGLFSSLWNAVQPRHSDAFPIRSEPCTRPQSRWGMCSRGRKPQSADAGHPNDQLYMKQGDANKRPIPPLSCELGVMSFSDFTTKTRAQGSVLDADSLTASNESTVEYATTLDTKKYRTVGSCKFPFVQSSMSGAGKVVDSVSSNDVMDASELCIQLNELQVGFWASTFDDGPQTADIVVPQPTHSITATTFVSRSLGNAEYAEAINDTSPSQSSTSLGRNLGDSNLTRDRTPGSVSSSSGQGHFFSPALSSTALPGFMSPSHLSQPETPTMSDCEDNMYGLHYATKPSQVSISATNQDDQAFRLHTKPDECDGFDGYSLLGKHHASALTLKSLPATQSTSSGSESAYNQKSGKKLVESWNDGAENCNPITDDLFDDLGYLGEMII